MLETSLYQVLSVIGCEHVFELPDCENVLDLMSAEPMVNVGEGNYFRG